MQMIFAARKDFDQTIHQRANSFVIRKITFALISPAVSLKRQFHLKEKARYGMISILITAGISAAKQQDQPA
ncbi:MAG TPA: hypothetical protein VJU59_49635 [Paraburkholderia sp.]|jgi:hypothetical protein|uniref:hypothetical protein n=1 Tax=Paraburkholderia sp. TaxID=1926495 RepID=UPI002B4A094E|nr:hypothetical protein [Paraburkholderia sp.]HKR47649.1 hypothetical protein [Paraburkholderia sp.]